MLEFGKESEERSDWWQVAKKEDESESEIIDEEE